MSSGLARQMRALLRRVLALLASRAGDRALLSPSRTSGVGQGSHEWFGHIGRPRLDGPVPRESLQVGGWVFSATATVSRVEIHLDGRPVGRARIGLPRLDLAGKVLARSPAASMSGFEWTPAPGDLATDRDRVRIEALATTTDGETFTLSQPEEVELEPPAPPFEDEEGGAASFRRKAARLARPRTPRSQPGMSLLAFTHRLDHGGAQRYFFEQVRYLMRDPDVSCTVVAPTDGLWRRRLETLGVDVLVAANPATGVAEYEGAIAQLTAWINHRDFDAVFANTLDTFLFVDLAVRLELPVVWSIHESFELDHWWQAAHGATGHPYARQRIEHALSEASALIFAADATKRLYEPYADPLRMVTAPYGLELNDIDDFRLRLGQARAHRLRSSFPENALLLLCLGTVIPRKGQAVLAQAFAQAAADHPDAHLVLVGDDGGSYSNAIRRFTADAEIGSRCTLVRVTSDAYAWHVAADVFALASDIESSPISILEAMAFETPVVASNVFGVPELIEDGRHGYLCEPNDVADLARVLDRVLRASPEERRRVALAGAERVRNRHDPLRYARSLRHLLGEMVRDRDTPPSWDPEGVSVPSLAAPSPAVRS